MKKKLHVFLFICFAVATIAKAQQTFPVNDVNDERMGYYMFTNATIHVDYQTVIEKGILVIKQGKIENIMSSVAGNSVPATPAGAVLIDLQGKHIYPSFIDLYSNYGMPEVKRSLVNSRQRPQMETAKQGAFNWNQAIRPETQASEVFKADAKIAEEFRKLGFGTVLTHHPDGIARGSGTLVTLSGEKENTAMLKVKASAHYSFDKGSSSQDNPGSLMGSISVLRQTYLDADWYKKYGFKEQSNLSLQAFNDLQTLPQIFETTNKLNALRADRIGDEFGIQYLIKSNGDEYQRVDELKATNATLIVPVNFPQAFDVEDPQDASMMNLEDMKHWEMAPANLAILAQKGISFAVTPAGLKTRNDFLSNLRKAILYGLDEKTALKALTFTPAQILKEENRIGSLKNGMLANFLITSDNIFEEKAVIYENWIQGNKFIINTLPPIDVRGKYDLSVGSQVYKLSIGGTHQVNDYKLEKDTLKITPKFTRNGDLFTISYKANKTDKGEVRLSGYLSGKDLKGEGQDAEGKPLKWLAVFKENFKEADKKLTIKTPEKPIIGNLIFPFTAFGNEQKPQAETILIKNATVWTNEKEGKLAGTDVLVVAGKIQKIGKNLVAPTDAKVFDGTGKHLTAGIIDEHSHIAISAGVNEGTQTVSSEVRISDVVNSEDINIYRQLDGGVVASHLLHGSANAIGGQSAFVKLKWGYAPEEMKVKDAQFIKFALGENVKQSNWGDANTIRFPQTRMGVEQVMVDAFTRAREYEAAWKNYTAAKDKSNLKLPRKDLELEALVEVLNKKRYVTCHSYIQSEITMLMRVAEKFNFRINTFTHTKF
ncbi:MAG: amidohydrolase [Verrucomicrobia bacterium]|nr:amidohydrolase [Cytophagales bacterium]